MYITFDKWISLKENAPSGNIEKSFLDSILDNTHDLGNIAAYADWLAEQGDPLGEILQAGFLGGKIPKKQVTERFGGYTCALRRGSWIDKQPSYHYDVYPYSFYPVAGMIHPANAPADMTVDPATNRPRRLPNPIRVPAKTWVEGEHVTNYLDSHMAILKTIVDKNKIPDNAKKAVIVKMMMYPKYR